MGLLFIISILSKRNDIVDIAWGPGIFLASLTAYLQAPEKTILSELLLLLTALWAFRLAFRIYRRNKNQSEDFRYRKWREDWGAWFYIRSFFQIYVLQGVLMVVLGASAIVAASNASSWSGWTYLTTVALLVWLMGYFLK